MTDRILYWTTVGASCMALVFFVANVSMMQANKDIRKDISHKQMIINTAQRVSPLNQQLSQALYQASLDKKNPKDGKKIQELLSSQGFVLPSKADAAKKK